MKDKNSYKPKKIRSLAIFFTAVLVFLTFEIPYLINSYLIQIIPAIDPYFNPEVVETVIDTVRPIGYFNLIIVIILIIFGFLIKYEKISVTSSFLLFLPTFGNFAIYMFFLAGFGILQVIWLPFDTPYFNFLTLGNIVFIPALPLCIASVPFGPIAIIPGIIMAIGLYIFTSGVINWLYGKHQGKEIIDFSIYQYSRHPQYLGFLIWSYGVSIQYLAYEEFNLGGVVPKSGLNASLPWVIFALIVVTVAFFEDIKLSEKYPEEYKEYRKNTPFLIKIPNRLKPIITRFIRYVIKKDFPETKRDVLKVVCISGLLLLILSLPLAIFFSINY
ncbi:MAG: methyltransferase family protein [Candidatus Hermodarchaeota archaeon]